MGTKQRVTVLQLSELEVDTDSEDDVPEDGEDMASSSCPVPSRRRRRSEEQRAEGGADKMDATGAVGSGVRTEVDSVEEMGSVGATQIEEEMVEPMYAYLNVTR